MFVIAIGLYALSSFILLILEYRKMGLISRISLLMQFAALFMMMVHGFGHKLLSKPGGSAIQTEIQ